ncbi:MAG: DUF4345 family protein [Pseudomonadota bacterium]
MDFTEIVNIILGVLTIGFGAIGLISPSYAMGALALKTDGDKRDGLSEIRAASGGAFVVMSVVAILIGQSFPMAWVMVGVHYAGAGLGRIVSIALDGSGSKKIWFFFAIEALFAAWFILANFPPL